MCNSWIMQRARQRLRMVALRSHEWRGSRAIMRSFVDAHETISLIRLRLDNLQLEGCKYWTIAAFDLYVFVRGFINH